MSEFRKKWWPRIKLLLLLAVLLAVGYHFWTLLQSPDLQKTDQSRTPIEILWEHTRAASIPGVLLSGALYLTGLGFAAFFWMYLMRLSEEPIPIAPGLRAYYLSQMGKYVPGKGLVLIIRASLTADAGRRPSIGALTAIYETLTTMAAGALVAVILLPMHGPSDSKLIWYALALLCVAGIPILPAVHNLIIHKLAAGFMKDGTVLPARLTTGTLLTGLGRASLGWLCMGASFLALWKALYPETIQWTIGDWLRCTSLIAISYVAGFVAIFTPGGLGVRELILQQFLSHTALGTRAVVLVLLLRLFWTVAELVVSGVVIWLPGSSTTKNEELVISDAQ